MVLTPNEKKEKERDFREFAKIHGWKVRRDGHKLIVNHEETTFSFRYPIEERMTNNREESDMEEAFDYIRSFPE